MLVKWRATKDKCFIQTEKYQGNYTQGGENTKRS